MIAIKCFNAIVLTQMKDNRSLGVFKRNREDILELSSETLRRIHAASAGHPFQLLLRLLWETGLQVREAVTLKVGDVDLGRQKLRIVDTRNACLRRGDPGFSGQRQKRERSISLPPILYYPMCRCIQGRDMDQFLFYSRDPFSPFHSRTVERFVQQLGKRLLIPGLTASAFRDTFILYNLRNGTPYSPLQKYLGYFNRQPFRRYEQYLGIKGDTVDYPALSLERRA
ncbi:MAG: site-specific integrase [Leptospiraceae bacterium]